MKTKIAIMAAFVLLTSSCVLRVRPDQDMNIKESANRYSFAQSYKVSDPANLRLSTSGGNISVTGYEGNQIEVSFVVKKYGKVLDISLDELKKVAEVEIINNQSTLEINVRKILKRNLSVGFDVKTPVKTTSILNTSGGNVSLVNLANNQEAYTSGGNLDIRDITGKVKAETSGGNVSVERSTGDVEASTSGGNISLDSLKGNILTSTSGGNIHASSIEGTLDAGTSGGSIHLDAISGSIKAYTSGGSISANVTKLTGSLNLETSGGNIDCIIPQGLGLDLNLSANYIDTPLTNFTGKAKKDEIQGQMNGGGIPVSLSTSGGNIHLNYK
jgi:hypothetical protein